MRGELHWLMRRECSVNFFCDAGSMGPPNSVVKVDSCHHDPIEGGIGLVQVNCRMPAFDARSCASAPLAVKEVLPMAVAAARFQPWSP